MRVRKEIQAIIYDKVNEKIKILLVKKIDVKNFSYRWRLLKGGVEEKESDKMALLREIYEEVGLKNVIFGEKIHNYEYVSDDTHHVVTTYLVKADSKEFIHLDTKEIADSAWIDKDQTLKIIFWKNEKFALGKAFKII